MSNGKATDAASTGVDGISNSFSLIGVAVVSEDNVNATLERHLTQYFSYSRLPPVTRTIFVSVVFIFLSFNLYSKVQQRGEGLLIHFRIGFIHFREVGFYVTSDLQ